MYFDVCVIIPLEEEFKEFVEEFEVSENLTSDTRPKYSVKAPNGVTMLVIMQEEQGYWAAASACNSVLGEHHFGCVICLGIAGAISADVSLGDVCYTGTIIDTMCNGKVRDNDAGGEDVDLASDFINTPKPFSGVFAFPRVMPDMSDLYKKWQETQFEFGKNLFAKVNADCIVDSPPASHCGDIVCGLVTESASYKKKLQAIQRKVLAVETEAGAVGRACEDSSTPVMTIRGISDLADSKKKELEEGSKGIVRRIAARNAVTFLKMQIHNKYFLEYLLNRRPNTSTTPEQLQFLQTNNSADFLAQTLTKLFDIATENLKVKNHAYRTLPADSILPLPRVHSRVQNTSGQAIKRVPVEIKQCIAAHRRVLLTIPRVFPDRSLPWLIAQNLCYEVVGEKQLVPIVIDGTKIRPPRGNVRKLSEVPLDGVDEQGGEIVYIIENFKLSSKNNSKYLAEQMDDFENSRFIVVSYDDPSIKDVEDFIYNSSCDHYIATDISFSEVSHFLGQHFDMPANQAEVIALRLRQIFRQFKLSAHPSFFAGIPQELLSAILDANRRAELIQLAVDGYLTFVVIEDTGKARLSRTTRFEFLKLFSLSNNINKIKFTRNELEIFCREFFELKGFPTDLEKFLEGFFEKGILADFDGRVEFGLSFIESYFIAKNLGDNEDSAVQYFDLDDDEFDVLSFDLYVEMFSGSKVVEKIIDRLRSVELEDDWEKNSRLCSNDIAPEMLKNSNQVRALERRIEIASEAVASGTSQNDRKQALLDLAERVSEDISEAHRHEDKSDDAYADSEEAALSRTIKIWALGVILLGQGAERIDKDTKDELCTMLTKIGAYVIDKWTEYRWSMDFKSLKSDLIKKENLQKLFGNTTDLPSTLEPAEFVSALIDLFEMQALNEPMRSILSHLSDEASSQVLLPAISKVNVDGPLTGLVRASWLADVDAAASKDALNEAIRNLPPARFLRVSTASHYVMRVYWSMADKAARLQLLDAANKIIKPMGRELPIGEIKRQIEASAKNSQDEI